ncbi:MAG: prepilin-type N-terminal cleavage/methylation domain-containing protein [Ruminococcus sp.]|nr:prepilin-type N-terminal cleavage/methylation domain-containing protein [Ruminococcus sp.]
MNNKMNKKGFTLVELIVVMAIFGIIMGAILNIIRPTNTIYNQADTTMHTNVIGSGIAEYLDDELRYSTNVMVLRNFKGVPVVDTAGHIGNKSDVAFTDCLILDNRNVRGSSNKDFDPSADTTSQKFGSFGTVIKVSKLNTEGFNLNNSKVAKGVDFYDKYSFDISMDTNNSSIYVSGSKKSQHVLKLKMQAYTPEYKNGAYNWKRTKYTKETSIELLNINIDKGDDFKCQNYDLSETFMSSAHDFPSETSVPAGATAGQQAFYSTADDNTYTYIFYQKQTAASANKCDVKLMYSSADDLHAGEQIQAYTGTSGITKGKNFKSFPNMPKRTGYSDPYWIDEDNNQIDTSKGVTINRSQNFYCVYAKMADVQTGTVNYQNYSGGYETKVVIAGSTAVTNVASAPSDTPDNRKFLRWGLDGDTSLTPSDVTVAANAEYTFVPIDEERYLVRFAPDGSNIDDTYITYVDIDTPGSNITPPTAIVPSGKEFDKWVVDGTSDDMISVTVSASNVHDSTNFADTKEIVFVATFKDAASTPAPEPEEPTPSGSGTTVKLHLAGTAMSGNNYAQIYGNDGTLKYTWNGGSEVTGNYTEVKNLSTGNDVVFVFSGANCKIYIQCNSFIEIPNDGNVHNITYTSNGWGGTFSGS